MSQEEESGEQAYAELFELAKRLQAALHEGFCLDCSQGSLAHAMTQQRYIDNLLKDAEQLLGAPE